MTREQNMNAPDAEGPSAGDCSEKALRHMAATPVLIVGAPRSGTTWLQRMLLGDPRCCGGQESHFFASFGQVLRDFEHKATMERPHGLACYFTRAQLLDEIRGLWFRMVRPLLEDHADAEVLIEKTPDHATWLDEIDAVLPGSRIIHLVRDSRAACASLMDASRRSWGSGWAPRSAGAAAAKWINHVEQAERSGAKLGVARFLRVHFEDLYVDPVAEMQRVWKFIGLASDPKTLEHIASHNSRSRLDHAEVAPFRATGELAGTLPREPDGFFRSGTPDAWKRDLGFADKILIWRRTRPLMQRLGYDRSGGRTARGSEAHG